MNLKKKKYEYFNITFYSKTRPVFCLQSHTLFNAYSLNIKKRKVNIIPRIFYDLNQIKQYNNIKFLDIELFVINTSGENEYSKDDFEYETKILGMKYNNPTPYEIIFDINNSGNNKSKEENLKNISNLKGINIIKKIKAN